MVFGALDAGAELTRETRSVTRCHDRPVSFKAKAMRMRNAIDAIDAALHGDNDIERVRKLFEGARDDLTIQVSMTAADLRQLGRAMDECNEIANSLDYAPANLSE